MGCINSTKKLHDFRNDNVFRVRVVRLQPESPTAQRNGYLELNPRELIFEQDRQPLVVWALQHLRRYGLRGDIFSFEAGRRCMTGPGIYTFQCQHADRLYPLFQQYVNAISSTVTDDAFVYAERDHPSHTLGRPDPHAHSNNYLEPAPMRNALRESFSSSPLSLELDSPDSVPSLSFTNEVVHFQSQSHNQPQPQTPGSYVNTLGCVSNNLYLEHPLRSQLDNETMSSTAATTSSAAGCHGPSSAGICHSVGGCSSAFSTLSRRMLPRGSSLDMPPDDLPPSAPLLTNSLHMYANVEGLGSATILEDLLEAKERCYENLSACQQKNTVVNYIVLDLDQPRSPTQCSPKTCYGSGLSLAYERQDSNCTSDNQCISNAFAEKANNGSLNTTCSLATASLSSAMSGKSEETNSQNVESSLGYSTIDFIKTCALIKSSANGSDLEGEHDQEELRITRHSKCVQKAYSISGESKQMGDN